MKRRGMKQLAGIMAAAVMMSSAVPVSGIAAEPVSSGEEQTISSETSVSEEENASLAENEMSEEAVSADEDQMSSETSGGASGETSENKNAEMQPETEAESSENAAADTETESETGIENIAAETPSAVPSENAGVETQSDTSRIETRAMTQYSYTLSEVKLSQNSIGGVSTQTILNRAKTIIEENEGSYGSVNPNDNEHGPSVGKMQWNAYRAVRLLKAIISANNSNAYAILGDSLYNEIVGLSETSNKVWSDRTLSGDEAARISTLLQTDEGKSLQDALEQYDISGYINRACSLNLTNAAAVVYYADIENQFGSGMAASQVQYAERIAGSREQIALNEMHIAALCYSTSYNSRRFLTYGYAATLGWTGCPSVNERIPYGSPWSDGQGVRWLQSALNTYMNAGLTVDGQYGAATENAVLAFQKSAGLDQDGKAGVNTISTLIFKMYRAMATGASDSVTTITGTPSSGPDIIYRASDDTWIYVVNGVQDTSFTGVAKNKNGWWYVENGVVNFDYYGVEQNSNGWWRIEAGKVNFNFNGFAENRNGWWYLEGGKVQLDRTDVIQGIVDDENGWWYVKDGKVTYTNTVAQNRNGWWYIENGKVNLDYYGVEQNSNGWWRIEAGKVNFNFNGFAENRNGWWYLEGGKVQLDRTDVIQGIVDDENGWWYVKDGKVTYTNTVAQNRNGWWYIENGKVNLDYYGVEQNSNGWWRIEAGKVNFNFYGFAENRNGWWYLEGGKVQLGITGVIRGTIDGESGSWYVKGGHVELDYSGSVVVNGTIYTVEEGKIKE